MQSKYFYIQTFLLFVFTLNIQNSFGQINKLRAYDDFSHLKNDTIKKGFDKLKEIKIGHNNYISFGGEIREQYQYFDNANFGDVPPTFQSASYGLIWHRIMVHSNIELGSKLRAFVQLNSTFTFLTDNPITPEIDENRLSLHQAFIDYKFAKNWMIQIGRQEIAYGNDRLLSMREGPNTRLTFDAAMIKYNTEKRKIDFFALTPVISRQYVFDDQSFKSRIVGLYATENFIPKKLMIDYYALNFNSDLLRYNYVSGSENRQMYGARIFSKNPKFNYELEGNYQSGKFNNFSIDAYAIAGDLNYKIEEKYKTIVGVAGNVVSGDKDPNDNKLNTYNLLFSKPSYGLAAPIGSSNIINMNPYVSFNPISKINILLGVYLMRRNSIKDGTYTPGLAQIRPFPNALFASDKKIIGRQYALNTYYQYNSNLLFAIDAAYFIAGDYIKETGQGKNISYISFKIAYKF